MDSPTEYVNQLQAELRSERAARERAERERDDYQAQVQTVGERQSHMTSAASLAAGAATVAINRLQDLQAIVDAAIEWRKSLTGASAFASKRYADELVRLLDAYIKRKASQS